MTELAPEEPRSLLDERFVDVFWLACFLILMFANAIQTYIGFAYTDELITCCIVVAAVFRVVQDWSKRTLRLRFLSLVATFSLVALAALGVFSNFFWGINQNGSDILIDMFTCLKFPVVLLCSLFLFQNNGHDLLWWMERLVKPLIVAMFLFAVANLFFGFGMGQESRFGLRASFMFICGHPSYLVLTCVGIVLVLVRDMRKNAPYIVLALLVIVASLRSKAFVFAAITPAVLFVMRGGRRINALHVLVCVAAAVLIGWEQFIGYYQADDSARAELTRAAIEIAGDHFPIGTGFATFASSMSATGGFYSPLYYQYKLNEVWGLYPDNPAFLSDTFWPIVLGQFGVSGFVLYLIAMLSIGILAFREGVSSKPSVVLCFGYLLIASTSETSFFNPMAVYLAMTLGILVASEQSQEVSEPSLEDGLET